MNQRWRERRDSYRPAGVTFTLSLLDAWAIYSISISEVPRVR